MRYPTPRALLTVACLTTLLAGTAGCVDRAGDREPGKLHVVAAFYPLQYLTSRVGGDRVTVTSLARPGVEPHDMELTPAQLDALHDADLVVYMRGVQPAVDEAVGEDDRRLFDLGAAVPLDPAPDGAGPERDPHVWLDPDRYAAAGTALADRLGARDPDRAAGYTADAAAFGADLRQLDTAYRAGLANCQRRQLVTGHAAFGYLARRYGLTQVPISGLSPDQEPSPRRMTEIAALARQHQATTVFFETLASPKVAETVARQAGATTAVLDPVEGVSGADDYPAVMRRNLATLRQALGCR